MDDKNSKRIKISFFEINKGRFSFIPEEQISESRARVKKEMMEFLKIYKQKTHCKYCKCKKNKNNEKN